METPLVIGLSRQMALTRALDVTANNIANMNTAGFKSEHILFEEYIHKAEDAPAGQKKISMVLDNGLIRNMEAGPMEVTGAALDIAIEGEGFFTVETAEGLRYTRNGRFGLNDLGELITREGHLVLDDADRPIALDASQSSVHIAPDGTISTPAGIVARIGVVTFDDLGALEKDGAGLFKTKADARALDVPRLHQGSIESSNVKSILEMTKMIDIMRSYQGAQKLIDASSELSRRVVRVLGEDK